MTLIEFPLKKIPNQPPEKYYGNKEYKIYLSFSNKKSIIEKKATQMLFRIYEGKGKAKYIIGIKDDGEAIGINLEKVLESIRYLTQMTLRINAKLNKIRIYKGNYGYITTVHVIKNDLKTLDLHL
tara:strand:+ start:727 stop:1101 length:375 start_codon:yes stop_codon:yes gene_type:complete